MENINIEGKWWIPGEEEDKQWGKLEFDPTHYPRLELNDAFKSLIKEEDEDMIDIIVGKSPDVGPVTLYHNRPRVGFEIKGPDDFRPTVINAEKCLVGYRFEGKPIKFDQVEVSFPFLSEWLNKPSFDVKKVDTDIKIKMDDFREKIDLEDGRIELINSLKNPYNSKKKFEIKESSYFRIELENKKLKDYMNFIQKIRDLLTLMVGKGIDPMFVRGFLGTPEDGSKPPTTINFYFPVNTIHQPDQSIATSVMLLPSTLIEDEIEDIFTEWIKKRDEFKWELDYYFGVRDSDSMYPNNKMLNLVQALESYHRKKDEFEDKYMGKDFDEIKDDLFEKLPDDLDEKVEGKMRTLIGFSNTFSLKNRLMDIYERNKNLLEDFEIDENLLKKVGDTRNHFTHLLGKEELEKEEKYMTWQEIVATIPKLRLMIEICLLKEIGVEEETIKKGLQNYPKFQLGLSR